MIALFNGNRAVTIISCSTNFSDEEDKDEFFTEITTITRFILRHNILLVGECMNTRIDKRDVIGSLCNSTTKVTRLHARFQNTSTKHYIY